MKKVLLLLFATGMMATTLGAQNSKETITLMSCVQCDDYFEMEIDVDEMVKLVLSSNVVSETNDLFDKKNSFLKD